MPEKKQVTVWIGGAAGDGIASTGDIFARTCSRMGLHVYAYNSYQSVIRGGHVLFQISVGSEKSLSQGGNYDLLIALNQDAVDYHAKSVDPLPGRGIIFNKDRIKYDPGAAGGNAAYGLPVGAMTEEFGRYPIMQNTVASGILVHLLGLEWNIFEEAIRSQFGEKKAQIADVNVKVARRGWEYGRDNFKPLADISLIGDGRRRALMTGNEAFALGALAGGCRFYSAYPMTPASSIMHWLAPRAGRYGLVMKQCEDELSAINMAIGAGFSGVRAMTGTSGGGFSLMTEAIGFAAMTETPVVIVEVQRGGPSTGLPTKTEQGDLFQVLGASQGEYPKAVIAPIHVEDAFAATVEALNLAEKYQIPVIVLSDLLLSEHTETIESEKLTNKVPIERGPIVDRLDGDGFKRYLDTPSGVSPRSLPGTRGGTHVAASDEHDETGVLISDVFTNPSSRVKMMNKRMRKMEGILSDTKPFVKEGPEIADVTLVGWGSTYNSLREVRLALDRQGVSINHLQFRVLWPFNGETVSKELSACRKTICVENNFSGLFARLVRQESGYQFSHHIRKYDGEPFSFGPLLEKIKGCLALNVPQIQSFVTSELDIPVKRVGEIVVLPGHHRGV